MTHVYLVVPEGVEAKSPAAVCTTREEATVIAEALWRKSDGYHSFAIECRRLGKTYHTFSLGLVGVLKPTTKPSVIEQVPEREVEGRY
jgi:hypothetical protein